MNLKDAMALAKAGECTGDVRALLLAMREAAGRLAEELERSEYRIIREDDGYGVVREGHIATLQTLESAAWVLWSCVREEDFDDFVWRPIE